MENIDVFESPHWNVYLNQEDQTYLGRCVVVCKRKVGSMSELTREEWEDFSEQVVKRLERACKTAFGATMFNWSCLMNFAYRNDPPDPQVHWHFRPRYKHPVDFAGEKFEDRAFGSHYERGTKRKVSDIVAKKIAQAIHI